ncbi:hypothetical protein BaRGS_00037203 [Batillaria attramentaria]|uniref:Uncharacterized protein n=1 Tax=Batillaria attramentaria TaxID=370345 RepID=A0ABD0J9Q7_9CAEN
MRLIDAKWRNRLAAYLTSRSVSPNAAKPVKKITGKQTAVQGSISLKINSQTDSKRSMTGNNSGFCRLCFLTEFQAGCIEVVISFL